MFSAISSVSLHEGKLLITGASEEVEGVKLVSRHVALRQPGVAIDGPETSLRESFWDMTFPVGDFDTHLPLLTVSTETCYVASPATFITRTWAQNLPIILPPIGETG